ncbi:MAG: glycosyltransferase [Patescibacteria group bacterium]
MELPLVSVVVTTQNEEKNIGNCLESIKNQTYPVEKIEIVVVDNNSSDATKKIAAGYSDKIYNFGPERSAQRNYGIRSAKGEFVIFADADMIFHPLLLEACVGSLKEGFSALHISETVLGESFWSQVRRFERGFYDGTVIDGARFFRQKDFLSIGGFDETMSGPEDWDLDKKLKKLAKIQLLSYNLKTGGRFNVGSWSQFNFVKNKGVDPCACGVCIFHNEAEFDLKKYLAKKVYYAGSFGAYINKWGKDDQDIKKQFGLWYRYFGVFLEQGKWQKLIFHPHLALGMYVLRLLVGAAYLKRQTKKG